MFFRHAMTVLMLAIFVAMVAIAWHYPADARFMPWVVGIPAIALCLLQIALDWRATARAGTGALELSREAAMWGYFVGLVAAILVLGFLITVPVFLALFVRRWGQASWRFALGLAAAGSALLYLLFVKVLRVALHTGFLTEYLLP